ncbi:hypothetical protein QBC38DRAFT_443841 [Podospora fimiseda]|uniref:Uncharacterized protein n=1 Tax=Podospora fimiseda TaxID=252190 RepID=A0AAN7BPW2_9PEZI|nr:hypothetical protein QBC38DRAFT_443841 [Podospora fimiseda]
MSMSVGRNVPTCTRIMTQVELDRMNYLHMGAALRGGHVSISDEEQARIQKENRNKEKISKWTKGPFLKQIWVSNCDEKNFILVTVALDTMARSAFGDSVNFVPAKFVKDNHLGPVITIPENVFRTPGEDIICREAVEVKWMGVDQVKRKERWFILPEISGVTVPLLGEKFIVEYYDNLLDMDEKGLLASVTKNKSGNQILFAPKETPGESSQRQKKKKSVQDRQKQKNKDRAGPSGGVLEMQPLSSRPNTAASNQGSQQESTALLNDSDSAGSGGCGDGCCIVQ